ncbi:hypothetical protein BX616_007019 [Lobosporangium transversale]|uniref:Uncharacterized protein n=1 Tax=Lobosporangium transversale TaxID=64571 RepID=A0A1Y2GK17_9FUNG|nr:hypothetical protein BCR41DRAFT_92414 [Lobosporangium transversale]KAF9896646.1 hypothetical protein BX616_007019 [Lobosporangium transversale]ORZ13307.1 hypothetical protein BCR41DRAFT_92414 [Lobosporangium transversale]|eukprot:XP_021880388.1 hypothetical protein BCR41DRAFT_92414 [Lobosporangium transversale]
MQRGVQDLTPESEAKDPFADRRGSSDFHRGAAIITPPIRPVVSVPTSNGSGQITSQPLPTSAQRSGQTNRASGQRRISLPSITEAPSPADVPVPMPRQSCDLGRIPQSTEPLIRNSASIRSTLSQPTRNISMSPTKSEDRISVKSLARDPSDPTLSVPSNGTGSAAMSNSPANDTSPCSMQHPQIKASTPTIGGQQQQPKQKQDNDLVAPSPAVIASATTIKRRKSMGSAALLSPPTENSVHRRKSFDHLMSLMRSNSKTRRPSDASIASEGTACSSETTGTSRTSISDHRGSLDAINVNVKSKNSGSCGSKKDSLLATIKATDSDSGNGNGSTLSSHLTRSASQPALEDNIKPKRSPVTFVKEAIVARQSLDLQRLAVNLDRTADKARKSMEHRNDSDSDLPGLLFRRRTMQEIVPFPKMNNKTSQYHTMGPSVNLTTLSDNQFHQQQHSNGSTSSLQEASPRLSIGSISSGSATVSGRFSRMWSSSNSTSKENLDVNDFGDSIVSSGEHASAGTLTPNGTTNRPRNSMLNRLSGLWSRR